MKLILPIILFTFFILHSSIANAIEVGGHLTEDTTWNVFDSPYLVTETLYVDAGVTLTILPGTVIKIKGAEFDDEYDGVQNFWINSSGWSVAKYIRVDGRIIAEGTEENKITFTRMQDYSNYNWGSICITIDAELSIFKHCLFEHMSNTGLAVSNVSDGLAFYNGKGIVRNSMFLNCMLAISSTSYEKELEIIDNEFTTDNNINPYFYEFNGVIGFISSDLIGDYAINDVLICNNLFDGSNNYSGFGVEQMSFAYNTVKNCISNGGAKYFYYNDFIDCTRAINGFNYDSLYIKQNRFIGGSDGINLNDAYVEISDNYFEDCGIDGPSHIELSGIVINNIICNANTALSGRYEEIYNNVFFNNNEVTSVIGSSNIFQNNIMIGNSSLCNLISDKAMIQNNIFINNGMQYIDVLNNPIFRNCIIDFPLDPPLVDGGGNIIVNEEQAQLIFEDIESGDFRLAEGSIAIDAGFDTLGYYYPFDLENSVRVWDGDGDGNAVIDIGAYEYGAPQLGKICGYITETFSGNPVDYVKILVNNEPGEFTFADSTGYFEIQLPEGTYDLYAERVFYEDNIIYTVTVNNEENTEIEFNMTYNDPLVSVENEEVQSVSGLNLTNYPNPFNPSTTISYTLAEDSQVELTVYNIKGQKVKTQVNKSQQAGTRSVEWSGNDDNNNPVSSGIYFYKITTEADVEMGKMILLK